MISEGSCDNEHGSNGC